MTNLAQYSLHKCSSSRGHYKTHWQRWGPAYLVCMAVPLVMADLIRHVLLDAGMWTKGAGMYRPGCSGSNFKCLSVTGWLFTIVFTYLGFAVLMAGMIWSANVVPKVKAAWKQLRGRTSAGSGPSTSGSERDVERQ
eukprot:Clim_evm96s156 gene=Clim_evmTU96s156